MTTSVKEQAEFNVVQEDNAITKITVQFADGSVQEIQKAILIHESADGEQAVMQSLNMKPMEVIGNVMTFAGSMVEELGFDTMEEMFSEEDERKL